MFFEKTFKPFFVVTGIGTTAAGLNAFLPKFAVENIQNIEFRQEYTIFVQHWGIMVCLMGLFMIAAAFIESWRIPILIYSGVEKAFMVFLFLSNFTEPYAQGFLIPAIMDAVVVIYTVFYFVSLAPWQPQTSKAEQS